MREANPKGISGIGRLRQSRVLSHRPFFDNAASIIPPLLLPTLSLSRNESESPSRHLHHASPPQINRRQLPPHNLIRINSRRRPTSCRHIQNLPISPHPPRLFCGRLRIFRAVNIASNDNLRLPALPNFFDRVHLLGDQERISAFVERKVIIFGPDGE